MSACMHTGTGIFLTCVMCGDQPAKKVLDEACLADRVASDQQHHWLGLEKTNVERPAVPHMELVHLFDWTDKFLHRMKYTLYLFLFGGCVSD